MPVLTLAQLTDTTCLQSRWISLKPNKINERIFLKDPSYNDTLDLIFVIKKLVLENKLKIYAEYTDTTGQSIGYFVSYIIQQLDDTATNKPLNAYFQVVTYNSDSIITNEYGDPIIDYTPDGKEQFKHPAPTISDLLAKNCDEIRIQENRLFNEHTEQFEGFIPVAIGFNKDGGSFKRGREKFWVNLHDLFESLDDKEKYPWYNALIHLDYQGFQYMQTSCYDEN